MITYKQETLQSLISFLQASGISYEEFCGVDEQAAKGMALPAIEHRVFKVSLWADLPWSRSLTQQTIVKVRPGSYEAECSCSMFYLSARLCWHIALVVYREQFYLDYERALLLNAAGESLEIVEKLIELRRKYFSEDWFAHHMSLKAVNQQ